MKLYFVSLGCDKNLVDSEKMLFLLSAHGMEISDDPASADVIVVNTCSFIHDARQESIETILEMAEYKSVGHCRSLIVCGCLAERYAEEIRREIPEVDAVVGTTAYDQIVAAVERSLAGEQVRLMRDQDYLPAGLTGRLVSLQNYVSYLKIAEGCSKHCSYCIIPRLRGRYRSVPVEELLEEAEMLADRGARELILVAQETTVYGVDLYGKKSLPQLLRKLCRVRGIEWIRLLYCYPEEITEELLETMRTEPKICHYLDIPIQHCSDTVLKKMGRRTTRRDLEERIARIRQVLPDVALRTTLISGFPGETEEQHRECLAFVREMKFDRLGVFPYSPEEGTEAAGLDGQLPEEVKRARADEIMEAEQEVIFARNKTYIGKKMQVIVDGRLPEDEVYIGRTYRDAPDIDGCVFFSAGYEIMSGTILPVRIVDARGYDLMGEICSEEEE